ncbi:MAG TPA: mechanosensitive ion channel domain-containing protein [Abditibacteriaceae bacterium]|nr:mechanosensitive ion channel domain-containing protein [Abditibacteriaceae bacterium]
MDPRVLWTTLAANFTLANLILKGAYVLCIAVVFEFIAWWIGRRIEKMTAPLITADAEREHAWRIRRRTTLRHSPKIISRTLCYTIALILIFDVFGVPVLPLSLAVGAVIALFGAALLPVLRDITQGYALLADDALAVGDEVEIGNHQGTVEKLTLRGVWLRDSAGHAHLLSNRNIADVIVHQRRIDTARGRAPVEFDSATPATPPKPPAPNRPPAPPRK